MDSFFVQFRFEHSYEISAKTYFTSKNNYRDASASGIENSIDFITSYVPEEATTRLLHYACDIETSSKKEDAILLEEITDKIRNSEILVKESAIISSSSKEQRVTIERTIDDVNKLTDEQELMLRDKFIEGRK